MNPRISWITTFNRNIVTKLVYGEAFQEPAPILLWGGWSGRTGRADMKPEKARNLELIGMYSSKKRVDGILSFLFTVPECESGGCP